ncbi:MAG: hypothetical protein QXK37_00770 [Candidatus Woesearchaeota archaeon]
MKAIVYYFEKSFNGRIVAEEVARRFEGELFPIEAEEEHSHSGFFGWFKRIFSVRLNRSTNTSFANYNPLFFCVSGDYKVITGFFNSLNLANKDIILFGTSNDDKKIISSLKASIKDKKGVLRQTFIVKSNGLNEEAIRQLAKVILKELKI